MDYDVTTKCNAYEDYIITWKTAGQNIQSVIVAM